MSVDYSALEWFEKSQESRAIERRMKHGGGDGGGMDRQLGRLEGRVDKVEDRLVTLSDRIGGLSERVGVLSERIDHLPTKAYLFNVALAIVAALGTLIAFGDKIRALVH